MDVRHADSVAPEFYNDPDDPAPIDGEWWNKAHTVAPHSVTADDLALDVLAGITGPPGPVGMVWRGDWSLLTTYVANDVVFSGGCSYICTAANTNHQPPNATYWDSLADRGATWWHGHGTPDFVLGSSPGDFYLDDDSGIVYQLT